MPVVAVVVGVELVAVLLGAALAAIFRSVGGSLAVLGVLGLAVSLAAALYEAIVNPDEGSLLDFSPFDYLVLGLVLTLLVLPGWALGAYLGSAARQRRDRRLASRMNH